VAWAVAGGLGSLWLPGDLVSAWATGALKDIAPAMAPAKAPTTQRVRLVAVVLRAMCCVFKMSPYLPSMGRFRQVLHGR
jgi:hypothetical protein